MQTEKFQPSGQPMLLQTRFTEFQALSISPSVGISQRSDAEIRDPMQTKNPNPRVNG